MPCFRKLDRNGIGNPHKPHEVVILTANDQAVTFYNCCYEKRPASAWNCIKLPDSHLVQCPWSCSSERSYNTGLGVFGSDRAPSLPHISSVVARKKPCFCASLHNKSHEPVCIPKWKRDFKCLKSWTHQFLSSTFRDLLVVTTACSPRCSGDASWWSRIRWSSMPGCFWNHNLGLLLGSLAFC
jgi:hypothetical protein